jgi:hypothetical protein
MTRDKTQGGAPKPPRAEPLQPDRPGRGTDRTEPGADSTPTGDEQARRQAEQEKAALENVRRGYR